MRKAILAAIELPKQEFAPAILLEELTLLLENLDIQTAGTVVQRRDRPDPALLFGKGRWMRSLFFAEKPELISWYVTKALPRGRRAICKRRREWKSGTALSLS